MAAAPRFFYLISTTSRVINDTFGHATGDSALRSAAAQLTLKVRSSDTLARCGGDEFCVIINELTRREDCERIAQSLREAVATNAPAEWRLAASIGYALFPEDAIDSAQLFAAADRRMYEEKVLTRERSLGLEAAEVASSRNELALLEPRGR